MFPRFPDPRLEANETNAKRDPLLPFAGIKNFLVERNKMKVKFTKEENDCPIEQRPRFFGIAAQNLLLDTKVNKLFRVSRQERESDSLARLEDMKQKGVIDKIGTAPPVSSVCPDDDLVFAETKKGFKCCLSSTLPSGILDLDQVDQGDVVEWTLEGKVYMGFITDKEKGIATVQFFQPTSISGYWLSENDLDSLYVNEKLMPVRKMDVLARLGPTYKNSPLWAWRKQLPLLA